MVEFKKIEGFVKNASVSTTSATENTSKTGSIWTQEESSTETEVLQGFSLEKTSSPDDPPLHKQPPKQTPSNELPVKTQFYEFTDETRNEHGNYVINDGKGRVITEGYFANAIVSESLLPQANYSNFDQCYIVDYEYLGDSDNIKREVYRDAAGNLTYFIDFEYNQKGKLVTRIIRDETGHVEHFNEYEYWSSGNLKTETIRDAHGNLENFENSVDL